MICPKCGRNLPENAKFCDGCGNALPSGRKQKKTKKGWIIGLCAMLAVLVAASVVYLWIPKTETVYVLKSFTRIGPEGTEEYTFRFDDQGNPTRIFDMNRIGQVEADYDSHGNVTEITRYLYSDKEREYGFTSEYKYSYDDDGRIESCKEYYQGNKIATWDYTWDKQGNLIQVIRDGALVGNCIVRQDWEYDSKNRLVTEYVCVGLYMGTDMIEYKICRGEYTYDSKGNLTDCEYAWAEETTDDYEDLDYGDLNFVDMGYYRCTYNSRGNITSSRSSSNGSIYREEYEYDSDGNLNLEDAYSYDDQGNLLWTESEAGYRNEWEYEPVEMSREAAARYRRWMSLYSWNSFKAPYYPMVSFANQSDMFYYYLIPNPIW